MKGQKRKKEEAQSTKKGRKGSVNTDVKKRERKTFDLPGQKRDVPEEVSYLI